MYSVGQFFFLHYSQFTGIHSPVPFPSESFPLLEAGVDHLIPPPEFTEPASETIHLFNLADIHFLAVTSLLKGVCLVGFHMSDTPRFFGPTPISLHAPPCIDLQHMED